MTRQRKKDIRLKYFKEHSRAPGFSSVRVLEKDSGEVYLDVGVTRPVALEPFFEGLPVQVETTAPVVNAVLPVHDLA
jgi:hypothetical protein